jgi:hypothetical protein
MFAGTIRRFLGMLFVWRAKGRDVPTCRKVRIQPLEGDPLIHSRGYYAALWVLEYRSPNSSSARNQSKSGDPSDNLAPATAHTSERQFRLESTSEPDPLGQYHWLRWPRAQGRWDYA